MRVRPGDRGNRAHSLGPPLPVKIDFGRRFIEYMRHFVAEVVGLVLLFDLDLAVRQNLIVALDRTFENAIRVEPHRMANRLGVIFERDGDVTTAGRV